jgi:Cys-tRNA(Pro)/Cys-tRNA(Cys) deacylase
MVLMDYFEKLDKFIKENNVECQHIRFDKSCHSVREAAVAANVSENDFVKNVCMIDSFGNLIVAIVKGEDRASRTSAAKALGIQKLEIASPTIMLEKSGYPAGGTPSFGYSARFLMDEKILEKDIVYTGGGSEDALVKISPKEMLKWNKAAVARIRN